jgi:ribonuclease HII
MIELAKKHPSYGFDSHVGYGTKAHMLALRTNGAIKYVHRRSFSPVAQLTGI